MSEIQPPSAEQLQQMTAQIVLMLNQAHSDLEFATNISNINQAQFEKFLKTTNAIYGALQNMYGHRGNKIHRDIIAKELTVQMSYKYPELIVTLNQSIETEGNQHVDWVKSQFARIQQVVITDSANKKQALLKFNEQMQKAE